MKRISKASLISLLSLAVLMGAAVPAAKASTTSRKSVRTVQSVNRRHGRVYGTRRVRKMIKGGYPIYSSTALRGRVGNTSSYKYSNIESSQAAKIGGRTYYHITADGRSLGWVSSKAMQKNVISVAHNIDMFYGNIGDWQKTIDAVNYATDGTGTYVPWKYVTPSKRRISLAKKGTTHVTYSYGKAHAAANFTVRRNETENDGKENNGFDDFGLHGYIFHLPWAVPTGHSRNWTGHFHNETHDTLFHSKKGKRVTWRTRLFQPSFLSVSRDNRGKDPNAILPRHPEGMAVGGGWAYSTYLTNRDTTRARIIAFNLNKFRSHRSHFAIQDFAKMSASQARRYAKSGYIKVGPEIKVGHGQMLTYAGGHLYLLADNMKYYKNYNEMMEISPRTLCVTRISDFNAMDRYFHYAQMTSSNTMYALSDNGAKGFEEIWKITRKGAGRPWKAKIVSEMSKRLINRGPIQGMAVHGNHIILATNDRTATIQFYPNGNCRKRAKVINHSNYRTRRETEGIAYNNGHLYQQMNLRGEFLTTNNLK